jgi:hypothetical protein
VVHEAVCCGCGIILSSNVGSRNDLLTKRNGWSFVSGDSSDLARVLKNAIGCSESSLIGIQEESFRISEAFGPAVWAQSLASICRMFEVFPRL